MPPSPPATVRNTPLLLIIRDGWGENPHPEHDAFNAIKLARTPVADQLDREWPRCLVKTSGLDVGVPPDQTGNSEVGHQNIGAGRIVDQEVVRISKSCLSGAIRDVAAIREGILKAKAAGATVHLMGIASDSGVHGLLAHLYALLEACKHHGQTKVGVHLFTDGRDTGPFTGRAFVTAAAEQMRELGVGRVASIIGRYWAMDRDHRWDRVQRAYECLTGRVRAPRFADAASAVEDYYTNPAKDTGGNELKGDEFVSPRVVAESDEDARTTRIKDGDVVLFYNYRGDRPREIVSAFVLPDEQWKKVKPSPDGHVGFERGRKMNVELVAMTGYSEALVPFMKVAFVKPPRLVGIAGEVLSAAGLRQFRCAETEKFPHVTFFFNDYREEPFAGEVRENPPSPRVATYDLMPEMAAHAVRDAVLRRLASGDCEDVLIVNFANCDMVGHTGSLAATIKAVEVTDACVGEVIAATLKGGGSLIVMADHGNAEQMFDPATGSPHTAHTPYDVPLYVVGEAFRGRKLRDGPERGRLADVMPTALEMIGLPRPVEMTGRSLLVEA
ncbi:MAG: 2,3-bisphosphoglycerate-independent phosphoglycerate mutase [Phycisphaerales bacterium]